MKVASDKKFDEFFKSSFEDFEVEPSANSWDKIAQELKQKPKKKFPIFWMAAASVVIVLGIGLGLYTQPTEVIKLKPQTDELTAKVEPKLEESKEQGIKDELGVKIKEQRLEKPELLAANTKKQPVSKENKVSEKNISEDATITSKATVLDLNNLEEDLARVKPVKRINSVAQQMIDDEAKQTKLNGSMNAALALAQNTNDENLNDDGAITGRKVKIKSVGDLVNFVVAKVDKREEKIIKVSRTDEGDNEITGINLGLFKFRKAEK
ncbi:hypothetical protein [Pedobacter cryophilus]|uniref:Uncharacterized protein n=1 Tax=Pedobacter cryophilus TaxID=2571271 RepID=A0A4U1BUH3_9SPHI|nr:hypothetical protein [Pedobacter cryophilus]TKB96332.1 hypothetical protein FA046_14205 [Pedobacter cryophilus]